MANLRSSRSSGWPTMSKRKETQPDKSLSPVSALKTELSNHSGNKLQLMPRRWSGAVYKGRASDGVSDYWNAARAGLKEKCSAEIR